MVESTFQAPKITSGEKAFITFLIKYVIEQHPGDMQTNLEHLSKFMLDNLEPKSEENLYRKQYGNLKDCVLQSKGIMSIFKLDGTCFKFHDVKRIRACQDMLSEEGLAVYEQGRHVWLQKILTLAKNNNRNWCKVCGQTYNVLGNKNQCDGHPHTPWYDWTKNEDVELCEI